MSLNGIELRGIEQIMGINYNSVIDLAQQTEAALPDKNYEIPETAQIDEMQALVGKIHKMWS